MKYYDSIMDILKSEEVIPLEKGEQPPDEYSRTEYQERQKERLKEKTNRLKVKKEK